MTEIKRGEIIYTRADLEAAAKRIKDGWAQIQRLLAESDDE